MRLLKRRGTKHSITLIVISASKIFQWPVNICLVAQELVHGDFRNSERLLFAFPSASGANMTDGKEIIMRSVLARSWQATCFCASFADGSLANANTGKTTL